MKKRVSCPLAGIPKPSVYLSHAEDFAAQSRKLLLKWQDDNRSHGDSRPVASALQIAELIEQIAQAYKAAEADDAIAASERVERLVHALCHELELL